MTWLELAQSILNMPLSEMLKPVAVFDYNDKINENADAITAIGVDSYDLNKPEDFMIVFNSEGIYADVS